MIIYGKNPVRELFTDNNSTIEELFLSDNARKHRNSDLLKSANKRGVKVSFLPHEALTRLSQSPYHQGMAAKVANFEYSRVSDIIECARMRGEKLLFLILDHVEDPQNLGAIIRTVNALGAHGIAIPKDRAASVTPSVIKASAGAVQHVLIAKVVNLSTLIKDLRKKGVWIVGADTQASKSLSEEKLGGLDLAIVVGNEGRGLGNKIRGDCDFLLSIPQSGKVASLNASVAAGIIIYELMKQRKS